MANAFVLDMPVELGLKLMPVIGADLTDPEGELFDHVVDKIDGICLGMSLIDFEGSDSGRIVDGGELEAADLLAAFSFEGQKLDDHLDVVAGDLFVVALGVDLAFARASWEPVQTIALEDPVNTGIRDFDAVIAFQIPDDPDRPQMVFAPEMQHLLSDFRRYLVWMAMRY